MTPIERIRLEKAAADCGFERTPTISEAGELELRSAQFPESVHIRANGESGFLVKASSPVLFDRLGNEPVQVRNIEELYTLLQRASAVARTMPNRVADQFRLLKKTLSQSTEAERLVVQRVGQELFRKELLEYWDGRCCVTGLNIPALLRASHIKPWAKCESDDERLDVFNGLLLAPHVDALFDGGWISFEDNGSLIVSDALPSSAMDKLGVSLIWQIHHLKSSHIPYLAFHRAQELRQVL